MGEFRVKQGDFDGIACNTRRSNRIDMRCELCAALRQHQITRQLGQGGALPCTFAQAPGRLK
jgi:hypothetical protein